jgi:hypothetical protein
VAPAREHSCRQSTSKARMLSASDSKQQAWASADAQTDAEVDSYLLGHWQQHNLATAALVLQCAWRSRVARIAVGRCARPWHPGPKAQLGPGSIAEHTCLLYSCKCWINSTVSMHLLHICMCTCFRAPPNPPISSRSPIMLPPAVLIKLVQPQHFPCGLQVPEQTACKCPCQPAASLPAVAQLVQGLSTPQVLPAAGCPAGLAGAPAAAGATLCQGATGIVKP